MNHDPQGYYARLELDWDAPSEAVHAAYRRKARVLHPDIPITGNSAAFMALKEAYDVLADPLRRAAYERAARSLDHLRANVHAAQEHHPAPPSPPPPSAPTRGPRLSDLPIGVWAILAMVVVFAGVEAALHLFAPPAQDQVVNVPPTAPTVPPETPPHPPAPIRLFGTPNVYVIPAGGPALVLRYDTGRLAFVPIGQLPAFSAAQAIRVLRANGLVEIRLTDTPIGFIDAARLAPGNLAAAHQAYCAYNSGPPPANGEILDRAGAGTGKTTIENRSGQPLVVKLRDRNGVVAATGSWHPAAMPPSMACPAAPTVPISRWASYGAAPATCSPPACARSAFPATSTCPPWAPWSFRRTFPVSRRRWIFPTRSSSMTDAATAMAITLQESLRGSVLRAVLRRAGAQAYAAEGVTVRFASAPTPGRAALGVLDGSGRRAAGAARCA